MPKITVVSTINHDGVIYSPGEIFDCTAAQAKTLCELGSAKMAGKGSAEAEQEKTASAPAPAAKPKGGKGKGK